MKKSILGLKGVKELTKNQMKNIQGMGGPKEGSSCSSPSDCATVPAVFIKEGDPYLTCIGGVCTLVFP